MEGMTLLRAGNPPKRKQVLPRRLRPNRRPKKPLWVLHVDKPITREQAAELRMRWLEAVRTGTPLIMAADPPVRVERYDR